MGTSAQVIILRAWYSLNLFSKASHRLQIKKEKIKNDLKTRKVTKCIYSFWNI